MHSTDAIFEAGMHTYRKLGAQDARYDLETFYVLLDNDRRLGRLSEEGYQEAKAELDKVKRSLMAEIAGEGKETGAAATHVVRGVK
jgi:hypothetical protein